MFVVTAAWIQAFTRETLRKLSIVVDLQGVDFLFGGEGMRFYRFDFTDLLMTCPQVHAPPPCEDAIWCQCRLSEFCRRSAMKFHGTAAAGL